jgi:hypothetical protein
MEGYMHKFVAALAILAMWSLFALTFWQFGTIPTGAGGPKLKFGDVVTSAPYLPIQRLEPVY